MEILLETFWPRCIIANSFVGKSGACTPPPTIFFSFAPGNIDIGGEGEARWKILYFSEGSN